MHPQPLTSEYARRKFQKYVSNLEKLQVLENQLNRKIARTQQEIAYHQNILQQCQAQLGGAKKINQK